MKTAEYLCVAQRTVSQSREARKKLWEGAKREQKELSNQGRLKKSFITEKERWSPALLCCLLGPLIGPVLNNRNNQKADTLFSVVNSKKCLSQQYIL